MQQKNQKSNTFSHTSTLRRYVPPRGVPFDRVKDAILGADYELSLVFIGDTLSRTLNSAHRGIDKPTNVLSFALDDAAGELFMNLPYISRTHKKNGRSYKDDVGFLFIHGLLHLKGYTHGSTMEAKEDLYIKQFGIEL